MKPIRSNRVIQILYPLFVYYIFYNVLYSVFSYIFQEKMGQLFCLMLSGMITIIPIYLIYRKVPKLIPDSINKKSTYVLYALGVICVVFIAISLNVIITHLGIVENSDGFQSASKKLTDGTLIIKILSNVMIIPILEELLYRGIIAGQVCLWYGWIAATIFSSFCFGISHFNIVQFLYALIVGIALGTLYCKTKRLSLCILAHGITNLIVILFS